jgi:hypothetical protein
MMFWKGYLKEISYSMKESFLLLKKNKIKAISIVLLQTLMFLIILLASGLFMVLIMLKFQGIMEEVGTANLDYEKLSAGEPFLQDISVIEERYNQMNWLIGGWIGAVLLTLIIFEWLVWWKLFKLKDDEEKVIKERKIGWLKSWLRYLLTVLLGAVIVFLAAIWSWTLGNDVDQKILFMEIVLVIGILSLSYWSWMAGRKMMILGNKDYLKEIIKSFRFKELKKKSQGKMIYLAYLLACAIGAAGVILMMQVPIYLMVPLLIIILLFIGMGVWVKMGWLRLMAGEER